MTAKVIHIRTTRPQSFTQAEHLIETLRLRIFSSGLTCDNFAEKTGCTSSTIQRLASGKTRWPRPVTLFGLLNAIDLKLAIVEAGQ